MADFDEAVILEGVQRMALLQGSGGVDQLKGKELIVFVTEVKNTSGDPLDIEAFIDKMQKLMMDKFGEKFRFFILKDGTPSYTGKAASMIDAIQKGKAAPVIQAEKMDKAWVEVQTEKMDEAPLEVQTDKMVGEENPVDAGKEAGTGWWDVSVGENGKYRLPDDYVLSLLALPRPTPYDEIKLLQIPNLAQHLGVTEESLEKDRELLYGAEAAARSKRIDDSFVLFQDKIREEWERQGYVEVDEEYITNIVRMQEYSNELAKEHDWTDYPVADRNDPDYASWYEY